MALSTLFDNRPKSFRRIYRNFTPHFPIGRPAHNRARGETGGATTVHAQGKNRERAYHRTAKTRAAVLLVPALPSRPIVHTFAHNPSVRKQDLKEENGHPPRGREYRLKSLLSKWHILHRERHTVSISISK